jgi:hypothetical protein
LIKDFREAFSELEHEKQMLQLKKHEKSAQEAEQITQHINNIDQRLMTIVHSFFEKDLDELAHQDADTYWAVKGLYFEYFPKEATEHYSALLIDPNLRQNALELLNHILITHPEKDSLVNQNAHIILADHFLRQIGAYPSNAKELEVIKQQACNHALQLNSDYGQNADLKEAIILVVFDLPKGSLTPNIETALKNSHLSPESTYQDIQSLVLIEKSQASSKSVQFSKAPEAPSAEEIPNEPNTNTKKQTPNT